MTLMQITVLLWCFIPWIAAMPSVALNGSQLSDPALVWFCISPVTTGLTILIFYREGQWSKE